MLNIQLKKLQKLAEAAGSHQDVDKVRKLLGPLNDLAEDAADNLSDIREKLQSQVLKDFVQRDDVEMEPDLKQVIKNVDAAHKAAELAFESLQEFWMAASNAVDPDLQGDD